MSITPKRPPLCGFAWSLEVPPGPNAGRVWRDARVEWRDAITGLRVVQLTSYRGHSDHRVGPDACWLDGGSRIVLVSDREGCGNLFLYDFGAHTLVQLTDFRGDEPLTAVAPSGAGRIAFTYGRARIELELTTLRLRRSAAAPDSARFDAQKTREHVAGVSALRRGRQALWLAGSEGATVALAVFNASTTGPRALAPAVASQPCVSPDGRRVVFVGLVDRYLQVHAVEVEPRDRLPTLNDLKVSAASVRRPRLLRA